MSVIAASYSCVKFQEDVASPTQNNSFKTEQPVSVANDSTITTIREIKFSAPPGVLDGRRFIKIHFTNNESKDLSSSSLEVLRPDQNQTLLFITGNEAEGLGQVSLIVPGDLQSEYLDFNLTNHLGEQVTTKVNIDKNIYYNF